MEIDFGDSQPLDIPLQASQLYFTLKKQLTYSAAHRTSLLKELHSLLVENNLYTFAVLCQTKFLDLPAMNLEEMKTENGETLKNLKSSLKDAEDNLGDIEVVDASMKVAKFMHETADIKEALEEYNKLQKLKGLSSGQKIDIELKKILLGLFWKDFDLLKSSVEETESLLETGGDWERRNKFFVYKGFFCMMRRKFEVAAECFQKTLSTFSCTELCSYPKFILYSVVCNYLCLNRVDFKKKIIQSSEVQSVFDSKEIKDILGPKAKHFEIKEFVHSLQDTNYSLFMFCILNIHIFVQSDMYLNKHATYWMKEMRVKAYNQYLQSYKTVTLELMSYDFNISQKLLDKELSMFISQNRIQAKIDLTQAVVESQQTENLNYQKIIKQGDLLLNKVQLLSRLLGS
eukprot:snap_masked-scaffold_3-processed-gene-11.19-mRNA-1 protein AED:0.06 eAED:0.10 QI:0/-1/0/1/-1/1/1/0/400